MKMNQRLKKWGHSLEVRIIGGFILIMLAMAIMLDISFISIQRQTFRRHIEDHGLTMARMLAQSVTTAVFSENQEQLRPPVEGLLKQENIIQVLIMSAEGKILLRQAAPQVKLPDCFTQNSYWSKEQAKLGSGSSRFCENEDSFTYWWPVKTTISYQDMDELLFSPEPVATEAQVIGHVAVTMGKEIYRQGIRRILLKTGLTIAVLALIAICCATMLIRRLTTPLRSLLTKISQHSSTQQLPDMDILHDTMLSLVDDLDQAFTTIDGLRQNLEIKVEERTTDLAQANEELSRQKDNLQQTINELQNTQAQLVQAEKMAALGQVVAGVAHEVNNTINFISASLPSLGRALAVNDRIIERFQHSEQGENDQQRLSRLSEASSYAQEQQYEQVRKDIDLLLYSIGEGTRRTVEIVSALQSFSRASDSRFRPTDINQAIKSTLLFLDKKKTRQIKVETQFAEIPKAEAQQGPLSQVFLNILNNSVQAMGQDGGVLQVSTHLQDDELQIRFTDSGSGIEPAILPRVFDPFFTTKEVGQGTGLGLSISYRIIQEHHGTITASSTPGQETTFTITLPLQQPAADDDVGPAPHH